MKKIIQAAAVTLLAASVAQAQQAVQWRVAQGGNGHWYRMVSPGIIGWHEARAVALGMGGDLASITSLEESEFVLVVTSNPSGWSPSGPYFIGPWLGGYQDHSAPDYREPSGGWRWVSGEPWQFTRWLAPEPNNGWGGGEDFLNLLTQPPVSGISPYWNDSPANSSSNLTRSLVVEWATDCNNDGVVDYGQCHDGTLPDYNGNSIPDCCERGEACVVGNYPVQWRAEHGGNGHWYQLVFEGHPSWTQARLLAEQRGGHLATLTSQEENDLAGRLSRGLPAMLLGGFQDHSSPNYSEPAGGWRWITDEPWSFANWGAGEPNNASNGHGEPGEDYLSSWTGTQGFRWGDGDNICPECNPGPFLVEWSADCNNDGIVDYGQIITGQISDANTDGIPDICQQPTCRDADLFHDLNINGADLGILLSQWGPNAQFTVSDINKDGFVNGADLGILLSFWGACP
jgi:hypothetical protein